MRWAGPFQPPVTATSQAARWLGLSEGVGKQRGVPKSGKLSGSLDGACGNQPASGPDQQINGQLAKPQEGMVRDEVWAPCGCAGCGPYMQQTSSDADADRVGVMARADARMAVGTAWSSFPVASERGNSRGEIRGGASWRTTRYNKPRDEKRKKKKERHWWPG